MAACNAQSSPLASASAAPIPPWPSKVDELRAYILSQPDQNATQGFWNGPALQKTFADGQCLQVRFYNWACSFDIRYKMRGVAAWLDSTGVRSQDGIGDAYRYYTYGGYVDPDDGWDFYGDARLAFGACGNRGPQSACGMNWCVNGTGVFPGVDAVPAGQSPYVDPNNRNNTCPWLK